MGMGIAMGQQQQAVQHFPSFPSGQAPLLGAGFSSAPAAVQFAPTPAPQAFNIPAPVIPPMDAIPIPSGPAAGALDPVSQQQQQEQEQQQQQQQHQQGEAAAAAAAAQAEQEDPEDIQSGELPESLLSGNVSLLLPSDAIYPRGSRTAVASPFFDFVL